MLDRLDNDPDGGSVELMITLRVVHAAIEIAPLDASAADIEQGSERGDRLLRTSVLRRDAIDRRSQLAALIAQLSGRARSAQLDVNPTVRPPAQPCPKPLRETLQRRPGLAHCLAFLVVRQRPLGQQNVVLRRRVAVDAQLMFSLMREELVALDGRGAPHAQLLLDAMQGILGVRGEDDLLAVKQTVLEKGAPDAVAVVVVFRADDVVEDNHGTTLRDVLGEQDRQTQGLDMAFAEMISASWRTPGSPTNSTSIFPFSATGNHSAFSRSPGGSARLNALYRWRACSPSACSSKPGNAAS